MPRLVDDNYIGKKQIIRRPHRLNNKFFNYHKAILEALQKSTWHGNKVKIKKQFTIFLLCNELTFRILSKIVLPVTR